MDSLYQGLYLYRGLIFELLLNIHSLFNNFPREDDIIPFPSEDDTPPVTKRYFVGDLINLIIYSSQK